MFWQEKDTFSTNNVSIWHVSWTSLSEDDSKASFLLVVIFSFLCELPALFCIVLHWIWSFKGLLRDASLDANNSSCRFDKVTLRNGLCSTLEDAIGLHSSLNSVRLRLLLFILSGDGSSECAILLNCFVWTFLLLVSFDGVRYSWR